MSGGRDKSSRAEHWEQIYASRSASEVGWYAPHLATSLEWIIGLGLDPADAIIDVGGGASTLVDDLLALGYREITVLDLSSNSLAQSRQRLCEKSGEVTWLQGDVTEIALSAGHYRLWHDRAAFHFLTEHEAKARYRDQLLSALQPGGYVVMGCFAPEAPPQCSGLPVQRYDRGDLGEFLGLEFELKRQQKETHVTPGGLEQVYLYSLFELAMKRV